MIIVDNKTSYSNRITESDDKIAGQVLVALGDVKGALKQYDDVIAALPTDFRPHLSKVRTLPVAMIKPNDDDLCHCTKGPRLGT